MCSNEEPVDLDGLNYLAGKNVDFINKSAMNGTILAHTDGNVPNLMVKIPEQNEFYLGELFYFFEFAMRTSADIYSALIRSTSRVLKAIRRICSPCLASRDMKKKEKNCLGRL